MKALTITEEQLDQLLAAHLAASLPPEKLEAIAERSIAQRIGQLTLEQAQRHLQCKNPRQLTDFCREHNIPIRHFGTKKRYIRIADIEAAQNRAAVQIAPENSSGTTIAPAPRQRAA